MKTREKIRKDRKKGLSASKVYHRCSILVSVDRGKKYLTKNCLHKKITALFMVTINLLINCLNLTKSCEICLY